MAHRRAVFAAHFLRPPSWTKRLLLREKPRILTGPFENPVRRWVRLREKARLFNELPPPRRVPIPKPARRRTLQAVDGVPRVSPEVLERRLQFLLSNAAIEQQLSAPLRPGLGPYYVEFACWERQMREVRRIYRAQYMQKLAEVTEVERKTEAELHARMQRERRARKQAHLQRVGDDMKRRAILKDRKRIEHKVQEALDMATRSKMKRNQIYWYRRMENLSKLMVNAENFEESFPGGGGSSSSTSTLPSASSGVFLSRNVSVPFLLRQLGRAKGVPRKDDEKIPYVHNVNREVMELSYDILPEDAPRYEPAPSQAPSSRERAMQLYGKMSSEEKMKLLEAKLGMLRDRIAQNPEPLLVKLHDELEAIRLSAGEGATAASGKAFLREMRGKDPPGLGPIVKPLEE